MPTLRNVAERVPYVHAGQFATLSEVLEFYRNLKPEKRSPDLEYGKHSFNLYIGNIHLIKS